MTEPVHVLHRCPCGAPGKIRRFNLGGQEFGTASICDTCHDAGNKHLARIQPVMTAMLGCGVSREVANDVFAYLALRMEQPSTPQDDA